MGQTCLIPTASSETVVGTPLHLASPFVGTMVNDDSPSKVDPFARKRAKGVRDVPLGTLYRRYYGTAYSVALSVLGNREDAEDVVQDVFIKLSRKVPPAGGLVVGRHYIERAARNRALDHRKLGTRRATLLERFGCELRPNTTPPDIVERQQERQCLVAAIERLPPRCREVIRLALATGWSQSRIARELGITRKAVEKQYRRARRMVRVITSDPAFRRSVVGRRNIDGSHYEGDRRILDRERARGGLALPVVSINWAHHSTRRLGWIMDA